MSMLILTAKVAAAYGTAAKPDRKSSQAAASFMPHSSIWNEAHGARG